MESRIQLSIDSDVLDNAQAYVRQRRTDLSTLVEDLLRRLVPLSATTEQTDSADRERTRSDLMHLAGSLPMSNDVTVRDGYSAYLVEKYKCR